MFIGSYHQSGLITYLGITLSVIGMSLAMTGKIQYSLVCFIFAGICDLFDGRFAHLFKRNTYEKAFGIELDSLGDMVNFIAFPIVLLYSMGLNSLWHVGLFCVYALAGITRLAHFNVTAKETINEGRKAYFQGLPVTYSALIFPVVWLLATWFVPARLKPILSVSMVCVLLLYIVNIKIPKPKGLAYVFFAILALVSTYFILKHTGM